MFSSHLRRWASSDRTLLSGALLYDVTFSRILGTRGASEPILTDLLSAWRAGLTGNKVAPISDLKIIERAVLGSIVRNKGELIVDLRMRDSDEHMIVEVQHRPEPHFPHRALLYASADVVEQHVLNRAAADDLRQSVKSSGGGEKEKPKGFNPHMLRPVHSLAFCDYDFAPGAASSMAPLKARSVLWRRSSAFVREKELALQVFRLLPCSEAMGRLGQRTQGALSADFGARLSFVFALLPHAPPLAELTAATPPLLQWASLIAHVAPSNIDDVPKDVRVGGVHRLLDALSDSAGETLQEMRRQEDEARINKVIEEESRAEGMAEGMDKGMAKGRAEGMAEGMAKVRPFWRRAPSLSRALAYLTTRTPSPHPTPTPIPPPFATHPISTTILTRPSSLWASPPSCSTRRRWGQSRLRTLRTCCAIWGPLLSRSHSASSLNVGLQSSS